MVRESTAAVVNEPAGDGSFAENSYVSLETIEVADPTGEEVLVEVGAASLCRSDISFAKGHIKNSFPLVMGHEGAGTVRAVGEAVDTLQPGDPVVFGRITCGRCARCREGNPHLCDKRMAAQHDGTLRTGATRFQRNGDPIHHCGGVSSFSEYTVVTEDVAVKINETVPVERATLLGCAVFTGMGAVTNVADIEPGVTVAVFGTGGVGLMAVQAAELRGAGEIAVIEPVEAKRKVARKLGATMTIDPETRDPVAVLGDEYDGGVDYAFEITGIPRVFEQVVASLGTGGMAVLVGIPAPGRESVDIDLYETIFSEKQIIGTVNGSYSLPVAIPQHADLVAKDAISLDELVTATRPLTEINQALDALDAGGQIRQVLLP